MKHIKFVLENEHGLHARPASAVVQICAAFEGTVEIIKNDMLVNGKSMLGIMKLGASKGDEITIVIDGDGEEVVYHALLKLIENKFDE